MFGGLLRWLWGWGGIHHTAAVPPTETIILRYYETETVTLDLTFTETIRLDYQ